MEKERVGKGRGLAPKPNYSIRRSLLLILLSVYYYTFYFSASTQFQYIQHSGALMAQVDDNNRISLLYTLKSINLRSLQTMLADYEACLNKISEILYFSISADKPGIAITISVTI